MCLCSGRVCAEESSGVEWYEGMMVMGMREHKFSALVDVQAAAMTYVHWISLPSAAVAGGLVYTLYRMHTS